VECRTTSTVLCIDGARWYKTLSYDPLNPKHEATGRVLWVNSTMCIICHYFPLGGSDPRVVWNKIKLLRSRIHISPRISTRLFTTRYSTKSKYRQHASKLKLTSEHG
jgi:hypothetical protein